MKAPIYQCNLCNTVISTFIHSNESELKLLDNTAKVLDNKLFCNSCAEILLSEDDFVVYKPSNYIIHTLLNRLNN